MTVRLPRFDPRLKRQSAESRRSPYAHEDAMGELLGRDAESIARVLGLAGRTVRQWRERYDTDHRGPGRTLSLAITAAVEHGRPLVEAVAPLRVLADEVGFDLAQRVEVSTAVDVMLACADAAELCAAAAAEGVRAAHDGRITEVELPALRTAGHAAIERIHAMLRAAEAAVTGERPCLA